MTEPTVDRTWPITIATLRKALGFSDTQGEDLELALFTQAACELIDKRTGRDADPTRHLVTIGTDQVVPIALINSAREIAKLWWQQSKNGPKGVPSDQSMQIQGPPMGATIPRKVEGWLADYPAPPGFGRSDTAGTPPPVTSWDGFAW